MVGVAERSATVSRYQLELDEPEPPLEWDELKRFDVTVAVPRNRRLPPGIRLRGATFETVSTTSNFEVADSCRMSRFAWSIDAVGPCPSARVSPGNACAATTSIPSGAATSGSTDEAAEKP